MEQRPSSVPDSRSASQDFLRLSLNRNIHYYVRKGSIIVYYNVRQYSKHASRMFLDHPSIYIYKKRQCKFLWWEDH
jgi:hypothetical protein